MRAATVGLFFLLAACDGGGDPVQQAMRDTTTANQTAALSQTAPQSAPHDAAGNDTSPGDQAFAASETVMHQRMMAASGQTVDQAYIAKMIEHHRGAVAMAEVALDQSRDPTIRRMAQAVKDAQTAEIAEMQAWSPQD